VSLLGPLSKTRRALQGRKGLKCVLSKKKFSKAPISVFRSKAVQRWRVSSETPISRRFPQVSLICKAWASGLLSNGSAQKNVRGGIVDADRDYDVSENSPMDFQNMDRARAQG